MKNDVFHKIMIVDDDERLLASLKRQLRKDFIAEYFSSPVEALDLLKRGERFAVIVSDMRMPLMDGIEFFEKVKEIDPHTVRIMLTGNADMQTAIDAVNRGNIFQFLTKPCDSAIMKKNIEEGLNRYKYIYDLQERSVTDGLTGLYNHKYIFELLSEEIEKIKNGGIPLSILMLDIDFFKKVNDTYGHQVGDIVLKKVAAVINRSIAHTDIAGRYGGEEFLVIFPKADATLVHKISERIRQTVADLKWEADGLVITISGGIAEYSVGETLENLIGRADSLLYKAKRKGRNRVEN